MDLQTNFFEASLHLIRLPQAHERAPEALDFDERAGRGPARMTASVLMRCTTAR
jgi:hypothetical protein